MCGIAGVLRLRGNEDDSPVVRAMLECLERRGPDDEGIEREGPLTLGNRRLAILDLSPAGHQPMRSADGRYLISFNGEIYNFHEVRRELGVDPAHLRSTSDTEILLLAWGRWGKRALERFVGQWAFAVYDTVEGRLYLARDRFGEKPLFYAQDNAALTFASSIPALMQAPWVPRELDPDALVEYVTLRYVVSPRSVCAGIRKLPGGHLLIADSKGIRVERWYKPQFKTGSRIRKREDAIEEFDELFAQAARRCLVSDVPVALLLSDGIDSNSIHAVLSGQGREVRAFTYRLTNSTSGPAPAGHDPEGAAITDLLVTPADRLEQMVPAFASFTEPVGDGAALATMRFSAATGSARIAFDWRSYAHSPGCLLAWRASFSNVSSTGRSRSAYAGGRSSMRLTTGYRRRPGISSTGRYRRRISKRCSHHDPCCRRGIWRRWTGYTNNVTAMPAISIGCRKSCSIPFSRKISSPSPMRWPWIHRPSCACRSSIAISWRSSCRCRRR